MQFQHQVTQMQIQMKLVKERDINLILTQNDK